VIGILVGAALIALVVARSLAAPKERRGVEFRVGLPMVLVGGTLIAAQINEDLTAVLFLCALVAAMVNAVVSDRRRRRRSSSGA
jgi:hypothetical protein